MEVIRSRSAKHIEVPPLKEHVHNPRSIPDPSPQDSWCIITRPGEDEAAIFADLNVEAERARRAAAVDGAELAAEAVVGVRVARGEQVEETDRA